MKTSLFRSLSNESLAYTMARLALGINLLAHGLVRLPKIAAFREWMVGNFEGTLLPGWLVAPFATVLPFVEFGLGILLLVGLFTKRALTIGALVMLALLFGSCLKEAWENVGIQMIYVLFYALLIHQLSHNALSFDQALSTKAARLQKA